MAGRWMNLPKPSSTSSPPERHSEHGDRCSPAPLHQAPQTGAELERGPACTAPPSAFAKPTPASAASLLSCRVVSREAHRPMLTPSQNWRIRHSGSFCTSKWAAFAASRGMGRRGKAEPIRQREPKPNLRPTPHVLSQTPRPRRRFPSAGPAGCYRFRDCRPVR